MENIKHEKREKESGLCERNGVSMTLKKVVRVENHSTEFHIILQIKGESYKLLIAETELYRTKFLRHIPLGDIDESEFYKKIRQEITNKQFDENNIWYRTERNGMQRINERWMFVFSNGAISDTGFTEKIYSGIEGYYIPPEAVMDQGEVKGVIKSLFREFNHNPKVFYPLFLLNLMAITSGYFRMVGEAGFMKITLWLAGASGSGKTELAKAVGIYTFADNDLNCNAISATARRNYVLKYLGESSGSVFLFDDVKREAVRERKNSVMAKIDDILRSVFSGRLTDIISMKLTPSLIDTCALITGEYMQTQESQNARLLYLDVDGFLKEEKNSEALRILQGNPLWVTTVCCDYIRWLLTKIEDDAFRSSLKDHLEAMRRGKKQYMNINNAARLNENRHMIEMSYILLGRYLRENNLTEEFISKCSNAATLSIESLCSNTFSLLGGEEMVVQKAVHEVMKNCRLRKARYQNSLTYSDRGCKYRQDYFMLYAEDDILFIEDYEESLVRNTRGEHDFNVGKSYMIIREERLMQLLYDAIKKIISEYPAFCISADEMISHLPRLLKRMQLIYKQHRSDGDWGRTAVKYPVCEVQQEWTGKYQWDGKVMEARCIVEFKPAVQLNVEHPYFEFLLERLEDAESIKILPDIELLCDVHREKMDEAEIYKVRKAFMSGKALYKE